MMRGEGEATREEKQKSYIHKTPSSNIRITNASITFHRGCRVVQPRVIQESGVTLD